MPTGRGSRRRISNTGEYKQTAEAVSDRNNVMDGRVALQEWKGVEEGQEEEDMNGDVYGRTEMMGPWRAERVKAQCWWWWWWRRCCDAD